MKPFPLLFAVAAVVFLVLRWRRLEPESKVLVALLAAGLGVYGSGAVEIPNLQTALEDVGGSLGRWTYLLVGVMAYAETGAFLGFVAPGEVTVLVGGLVAGQGKINVIVLLAIVWSCAVAGDMTSFWLGRRLGRDFLIKHGPRVRITEERLSQVEAFFQKRGGTTILVGRFLGLVRPIAPFLAGSTGMSFRRFVPYDVIAAGAWSTTFVMLGYLFWHSFDRVVDIAHKGAFALGGTAVVVATVVVGYRQLRDEENRARVRAWFERQAERPLLRPFARVLLALWDRAIVPAARVLSGPARFAWNRLTPGELGLELTTLLAVAAVGSFVFFGYLIVLEGSGHTPGDVRVLHWFSHGDVDWLVQAAKVVTWLGNLIFIGPLVALSALVLVWRERVLEAAVLVSGLALTVLVVHVTKSATDQARPPDPLVSVDGSSFPSAHAAYSVALVAVAVALTRTAGVTRSALVVVIAVGAAAVVGATRIYLRAHYLSDVLAGFGAAATIFSVCAIVALVVSFVRHNGTPTT
ncbi:MAG TPA: VTT domain-containing protein [Solirubrobacteraceae bacterium]|nr:VTT domain-containing protein [Solirubrobacteraceae bacterium]